jgi:superfamily I DNA/RNA helicase
MEELQVRAHETAVLEMNHRCPPEVTELARGLRAPAGVARARGRALGFERFASPAHAVLGHAVLGLIDAVRVLETEDPQASIAVIARTPEAARSLSRSLHHGLSFKLALDGRFDFKPGLVLTSVSEVKGLEFDHVLVFDVTAESYPDTLESRRALYVAVTRATHQLALLAAGRGSPLIEWA